MVSEKDEPSFKKFLLVDKEDEPPAARYWWYREGIYLSNVCLVVHLSPTVEWLNESELPRAKDALYTYVRRVEQTALEHDFMRPVACVISPRVPERFHESSRKEPWTTQLWKDMKGWTAEQDWHRGAFALYVEDGRPEQCCPDLGRAESEADAAGGKPSAGLPAGESGDTTWDHRRRIKDLLQPQLDPVVFSKEELEPRDEDWFAGKLQERLIGAGHTDKVRGLADRLVTRLAALLRDAGRDPKQVPRMDEREGPHVDWMDKITREAEDLALGSVRT
ncbi:hypothetical protein BMS3Bbin13_00023 [bacterium BMS3Bbin13]|nr:hypothetical protein BMS3Bbin13_00023 [bacterium BMS3Bbin13]